MASCLQSIQNKINTGQLETIPQLSPNTNSPISITNSIKQLFILEIIRQETVKFTISLVSAFQPTNIGVTVTFYQIGEGNQIVTLGSVLVTEMILDFQKDLTPGLYIICIGAQAFSYTGNFLGIFTGFPIYAKPRPEAYSGTSLLPVSMEVPLPDRVCNKTLYFSILDGKLPPGLMMTELGNIYGILPNMDCVDDNQYLSPSQNWYYSLDGAWFPWGRQWRFQVKMWIGEYPEAFAIRWFCIRVHNNWSWDRDNFKPPFEYEVEEIQESKLVYPTQVNLCCEPEEELTPFVPTPLPVLCPCESESDFEKATTLNFLQWYENNLKQPSESPYVQAFVDKFKSTDTYTKLMIEAGKEDELSTPHERELKAVEKLIKSYMDALSDGRGIEDIDYQMLESKDLENQKLPVTALSQSGSILTVGVLQ